jgi:hypothetical protein
MEKHVALSLQKKFNPALIANFDETMNTVGMKTKRVMCISQRFKEVIQKKMSEFNEHITLAIVFPSISDSLSALIFNYSFSLPPCSTFLLMGRTPSRS